MKSPLTYSDLLEKYNKLKKEVESYKKQLKNKSISEPMYIKDIQENEYPPQAF
tara:strand:- start:517 stop:675 length:159 start_codon:yes stop_codon:yes gene_type:complete